MAPTPLSSQLKDIQKAANDAKNELKNMLGNATGLQRDAIKATQAYKDQLKILKEANEQVAEIKRNHSLTTEALIQQEGKLKGLKGISASLVALDRERLDLQDKIDTKYVNTHDAINSIASMNQELLSLSAEDVIARAKITESIKEALTDLKGMEGVTDKIVENLQKQFDKAKGIASMTEGQQDFLEKQLEVYKGIQDSVAIIFETMSILTSGPMGALGVTLLGAGKALNALGENLREFGGTMDGAVYSTTALDMVFKSAKDSARGLAQEFGGMKDISAGVQLDTNLLATNMGISGEEAAKTLGIFARLNGNSQDTAFNLASSTAELARANGLNTAQVMQDVAANANAFAEYSSDGGLALQLAAAQAAKLGVNLDTMTKVTDSLLDFETSITKELELGAMLGRNINLNKARGLAYDGKVGAAVKETIRELGGIQAFNEMDIFAKRETAKLLGLSVEELQKMSANMENIDDMGNPILSKFDRFKELMKATASGPLGTIVSGLGSAAIAMGQMGFDVAGMLKRLPIVGRLFQMFPSRGGGPNVPGPPTPPTPQINTPEIKGSSIGDKLKDLASGLKEMGTGRVLFGAFNLIPTGIGLAAMLVGLPTLYFLSKIDLIKVGLGLAELAIALGFMGTSQVMLGGVSVGIAGAGFALMTAGIPAMGFISAFGAGISAGLNAVATGMLALGKAAKSGYVWLGVALLAAVGAAMIPYTYAISLLTPVIEAFGNVIMKTLTVLPPVITAVADGFIRFMDSITLEKVAAIGLLSLAFYGLASSLMFLGTAGILGLPALLGIAAAASGIAIVAELFGIGGSSGETGAIEGGTLSEYESTMLEKMDHLISVTASNKDVYLDKDKVTSLIMAKSDKSILNKLNIFNS